MNISADMIADLVINILSILVLFFVVRKLAYKPVKKFMDARTERIMNEKENALKLASEAKQKSEKYEELLKKCEDAEKKAIQKGEDEAREEAEHIIDAAHTKASQIIGNAEKKAAEKYEKAVEEAQDEIVDISLEMASKLLSRQVNDEDNRKIVEEFLASIGDENA